MSMSAPSSPSPGADSPSPSPGSASSTSPLLPRTQREGSGASYFSPLNSPRLGTIKEHVVAPIYQRNPSVSSISFLPAPILSTVSWASKPKSGEPRARKSSPPAPVRFEPHVSFDNFAGGEATESNTIAFTLNMKHTGYQHKRRSRTFMVGIDENAYSDYALQWMLDEMVDDGDEIVCLRVVDKDAKISNDKSLDKKLYREEANKLMQDIQNKNAEHRAISIVLEFAVGKLHTTFQKMIQLYEPAMLIVGTRGRSLGGFQGLVNQRNSFSKWCLQYSPIPVVVVRPNEKREKKRAKRANDPARQNYVQLLNDSGRGGIHEADVNPKQNFDAEILTANAPDKEAHEVAAALGLPAKFDPTLKTINFDAAHLGTSYLRRSDATSASLDDGSRTSSRASSPETRIKTPKSTNLETPQPSDDEDSDDEEAGFETIPGHLLLGNDPKERQQKLHEMEVGEAAALAAGRRKGSIGSIDSSGNDLN